MSIYTPSILFCSFCNRECKNSSSYKNHVRLCKLNPNAQKTLFHDPIFQRTKQNTNRKRSNQYIKCRELGIEYQTSDETRKKISESNLRRTKEFNKKNGEKLAKTIRRKVEEGTWHTSLAKRMHINYNGVDLHGSWELAYAQYLDRQQIKWIRNKESFPYHYEDKQRRYTPDFYLPESDVYIEIKGYKTAKDDAKWTQFPSNKKLEVLMEKELKELKLI